MRWTQEQARLLQMEHERIGHIAGEPWPAPDGSPDDVLRLMALVPEAAGLPGFLSVLRANPAPPSLARRVAHGLSTLVGALSGNSR